MEATFEETTSEGGEWLMWRDVLQILFLAVPCVCGHALLECACVCVSVKLAVCMYLTWAESLFCIVILTQLPLS